MNRFTVGVVGNPNCGKTTVFNVLTGSKQQVGNWPGVTVDRKTGHYTHAGNEIELVDLPGIYTLDTATGQSSLDENIAQHYILSGEADLFINVIDAGNLERNLYLATQMMDMGVPMLLALNMMDVVAARGDRIDIPALEQRLGLPIVEISAAHGQGIAELREKIDQCAAGRPLPATQVQFANRIEQAVSSLIEAIHPRLGVEQRKHQRWIALKLLEGDPHFAAYADDAIRQQGENLRTTIEREFEEDIDILIADARYGLITEVVGQTVVKQEQIRRSWSDRVDAWVLHRALGIPIFLGVMYLMFLFTINLGGAFIDFFDLFTGTLLVDGTAHGLTQLGMPAWLVTLLSQGVGGGIQVVATFIPVIAFLFLFLSSLEDSGYMARAAFIMDRFMRWIGLPGKSFVPMIVGFGCNVPAIMATRTLENERDRHLTVLMTPFMSCGARLPVYALFAAAFFASSGQNLVFGLYLLGIGMAILSGLILKNTLMRGEAGYFVMELPPYHMPTVKGVLLHTWDRLKGFIGRAGKIIVPMVVVISFLNALGTDGSLGNEDSDQSVLGEIGKTLTPAFAPMGIQEENWPATVGLFTGILAKEVVVGTLDALYGQLGAQDTAASGEAPEEAGFDLVGGLGQAFASIPANLGELGSALLDPLGIRIGDTSSLEAAAADQAVANATFGAMMHRFDGAAGAFAYLIFILMYFPCTAAIAAIYRETGTRWTLFVAAWTTGVGYISAVLFYQIATFARNPLESSAWIGGLLIVSLAALALLRAAGNRKRRTASVTEPEPTTT